MSDQQGTAVAPHKKQRRGFAAMSEETRRRIASLGGKASHAAGTGHEWDASTAREAGRKGGIAAGVTKRRMRTLPTESTASVKYLVTPAVPQTKAGE